MSLQKINQKLQETGDDSIRTLALNSAKDFKTSWIKLGQVLYTIHKDKLHKEWGFQEFDNYVQREIGIRKETAAKLLRSYLFLEKEEPQYLKDEYTEEADAAKVPNYESINVLRLAKANKTLEKGDYDKLKKSAFEDGKDPRDLKKDLTQLIKQRKEVDPEEERQKTRHMAINRLLSALRGAKRDIEALKILPGTIAKGIDMLIEKIESEQ